MLTNSITSIKSILKKFLLAYVNYVCRNEYRKQNFSGINERPIEYEFVFRKLTEKWPKSILDIGTGVTALPHLMRTCGFMVTSTDNIKDYWPKGMINRHFHVINDDITNSTLDGQFDFITCISVLEHVHNFHQAVKTMFSLLKPLGSLVLTFPYSEQKYVKNVYELPNSKAPSSMPFITQAFSRAEINAWIETNNGCIIDQEYWRFFTGEYWTAGDRICPPLKVTNRETHQLSCLLLQKNQ
jgi:SAM-dependent methyltransferase